MIVEVKIVILEGILTPILLYEMETWSVPRRKENRIQKAAMKILRPTIRKIRRNRGRNKRISEKIRMKPIIAK